MRETTTEFTYMSNVRTIAFFHCFLMIGGTLYFITQRRCCGVVIVVVVDVAVAVVVAVVVVVAFTRKIMSAGRLRARASSMESGRKPSMIENKATETPCT